jgi:hypothetical protein
VHTSQAGFLDEQDRVLGLVDEEGAKAYSIKILNWHEIVNETLAGKPVVVTYIPLGETGIGFAPGEWTYVNLWRVRAPISE